MDSTVSHEKYKIFNIECHNSVENIGFLIIENEITIQLQNTLIDIKRPKFKYSQTSLNLIGFTYKLYALDQVAFKLNSSIK